MELVRDHELANHVVPGIGHIKRAGLIERKSVRVVEGVRRDFADELTVGSEGLHP